MVNQHGEEKKIRTSVMLSSQNRETIEKLARDQERSFGYIVDKLIAEALRARGLLDDDQDT